MRYIEFKNEINSSDFSAILFQGEEAFFREDAIKTLKQKYNSVEGMDFDLFDENSFRIKPDIDLSKPLIVD